ncbi:FUSC family protein [Streptococcus sp. CSL10205-OR2]|uniref:FUSC family protein n=1 Tax=Streptococcus sp. CSL10205-OR2 TaxID=2980558 RepID=UPI0021DA707B|nr:aromatic acid exporter family protein [Streptococcus sp. CSL10205-OR2]MCU9533104.1 aromatic acid exporter family protein [Streptococcus sp. CSL10205-OR2]
MKYRFNRQEMKIGMRTAKTGLSVFTVLLLFHLLGWEGTQIAALTTVFSLRQDFDKSLSFGWSRIIGNSIGGLLALVFYMVEGLFHHSFLVTLFLVPILTMLTIVLNVAINNKSGIIGATAALLIITLAVPSGDTIIYVFARIFETFVGVFIAIIINSDIDKLRQFLTKK